MAVWLADWYVWQMYEGLCWLRSVVRATEESAVGLVDPRAIVRRRGRESRAS